MGRLDIQNWFINGALDFWQRIGTTEANLATSSSYYADRFKSMYVGTVTGTPTIVLDESVTPGFSRRSAKVKFQRNASTFTTVFEQRIEADNARELGRYGVASASLQVNAPVSGCQVRATWYTPSVRDNHTTQNQIAQSTVNMATSGAWELVKFENITIPATSKLGLAVKFEIIVPSGTDGSVAYLYAGEFMLNCGKKVKPFQMAGLDITDELARCQRYCSKNIPVDKSIVGPFNGDFNVDFDHIWTWRSGNRIDGYWKYSIKYPVMMRAIPTITSRSYTDGTVGDVFRVVYQRSTGAVENGYLTYMDVNQCRINLQGDFTGMNSQTDVSTISARWLADSEL